MSDDEIQTAVEDALDQMWRVFDGQLNFLATHFSCGTPGRPGYIMKSGARAHLCPFDEWASNNPSLHANVLIRHARQFQRSITVPALLAKQCDAEKKSVALTLKVRSRTGVPLQVSKKDYNGYAVFIYKLVQVLRQFSALLICLKST